MEINEIKSSFIRALDDFYRDEIYLLINDVSERAITHKLAEHMNRYFKGYQIDCEYNRNLNKPKIFNIKLADALRSNVNKVIEKANRYMENFREEDSIEGFDKIFPFSAYPDIIVHQRGSNHPSNLLIIEVKKMSTSSIEENSFDLIKLKAFTDPSGDVYKYLLGIHLKLGTKDDSNKHEITYYVNGQSEG